MDVRATDYVVSLDIHPDTLSEFAGRHLSGHSNVLRDGYAVSTDMQVGGRVLVRATTQCTNGRALTILHGIHERIVK
jgi:hypothetical protein